MSNEFAAVLDRAEERAHRGGYHVADVAHVVAEIVASEAREQPFELFPSVSIADAEAMDGSLDGGRYVRQVLAEREHILRVAGDYALRRGADLVEPAHYLVASCLACGSQMDGLSPRRRIALARIATREGGIAASAADFEAIRFDIWASASSSLNHRVSRNRLGRVAVHSFATVRDFLRQRRHTFDVLLLAAGQTVREFLWVLVAWGFRTNRRSTTFLGIATPSGFTRSVPPWQRLRAEVIASSATMAMGFLALFAWQMPQLALGTSSQVPLSIDSEEQFIATSLVGGGGVLRLGPFIAFSLLAAALPTWDRARRMRWTASLYGGRVTRAYCRLLDAITTATRPADATLGRFGIPSSLTRGAILILAGAAAMRWMARIAV